MVLDTVGVVSPYKAKYKLKYDHALSTEIFKFTFFLQAYALMSVAGIERLIKSKMQHILLTFTWCRPQTKYPVLH